MGNWVAAGIGDVGSFQVSGIPFTYREAGNFTVDFKFVTRAITVTTEGDNAGNLINFGAGTTDVSIPKGSTRFEVKCKQINVTQAAGTISVVAEMTEIDAKHMTGSIDLGRYGTIS